MLGPSSVPAHTSVTRGTARSVSLLHGSGGRLPLVPPSDSEACTLRSAGCGGPPVTRSFFPCRRGRGSRRSLGTLLLLGAPEARKSINTVIAPPSPDRPFPQAKPHLWSTAWAWSFWQLGVEVMCSPNCWNYFPLDFLKHATVYQKRFSVYMVFFFFFPSADCSGNHSIQFPRVLLLASLLSPNQLEMNEKIYKKKKMFHSSWKTPVPRHLAS